MPSEVLDLRSTIIPKSDQLNSEQLLGGPMTVTVTAVRLSGGEEQPVVVHYAGENGRPFKPCKSMRKVLIFGWGPDGNQWVGRSMTLYNDPSVKWGGEEVGGIRISHMTDIERDLKASLTTTRGKKSTYLVKRLVSKLIGQLAEITSATDVETLKNSFGASYKATKDPGERTQLKAAYDKRLAELQKPGSADGKTAEQFKADIDAAPDRETAALLLDAALSTLPPEQHDELQQAFDMAWTA